MKAQVLIVAQGHSRSGLSSPLLPHYLLLPSYFPFSSHSGLLAVITTIISTPSTSQSCIRAFVFAPLCMECAYIRYICKACSLPFPFPNFCSNVATSTRPSLYNILNYNPHPQQQMLFSLPYSTFSFYST